MNVDKHVMMNILLKIKKLKKNLKKIQIWVPVKKIQDFHALIFYKMEVRKLQDYIG